MKAIKGNGFTLMMQTEPAFRQTPSGTNATELKFSSLEFGTEVSYSDDPTIQSVALQNKPDYMDSESSGTVSAIMCLNEIGFWLRLLWGAPVTTARSGGKFDHVFTLSLADKPTWKLFLENSAGNKFMSWNGVKLNSLSFDMADEVQNVSFELLGCTQFNPTTSYGLTATKVAKSRTCTSKSLVYDVAGSGSTLGEIAKATIEITNDLEGHKLMDGLEGFGQILEGQPMISGTATVLLTDGLSMIDHSNNEKTKPMTLVLKSRGDEEMHIHLPKVMFKKPKVNLPSSAGVFLDVEWIAFVDDGAVPVITLINKISGYR